MAPVLDTIFTGLEGLRLAVDAASSDAAFQGTPINRGTDMAFAVGTGLLFAGSAWYGYAATEKCGRAINDFGSARPDPTESAEEDKTPLAPPAPPAPLAQGPKPFDHQAARAAIVAALASAERKCHPPAIQGQATLTYGRDGHVTSIAVDPPLPDGILEECLSAALLDATVPAYDGESVSVKKSFHLGP